MPDIPLGLRHAIETGECVLFVGAGIGGHLMDSSGEPAPDAATLAEELADQFGITALNVTDLSKVAAVVELRKGRPELEAFLRKRLGNLEPDTVFQWLFTRRWKAIFTTNFDSSIQRAYELITDPPQKPITISSTADIVQYQPPFEVPIYHLHGALFATSRPQIVITEDDYTKFRERRRMLFELLKKEFATSTILYVGYSNRDPNWKIVLNEVISEFYPNPTPHSYRIAPTTDPLDAEILKAKNIETIDAKFHEFANAAVVALSQTRMDIDWLTQAKSAIPSDLMPAFEKSPVAVARLLSSWEYVNQSPFNAQSNLLAYLRGDRPNWSLIGSREIFERDIEDDLFDELLDYATSLASRPAATVILGSAGYGMTSILMAAAARLIQERAGPVFMLRSARNILEGDVEFAASVLPGKPFFFVDNAADHSATLNTIYSKLRDTGRGAMFVLADRQNEWHQARNRPPAEEFIVEPLSDPEIDRLLEYLTKHGQLGALAELKKELQVNAIKEKHLKELLVVMRETTEGRSFDAILEDEFWGIMDPLSRRLYLTVCCFYQHSAYVRDKLLSQLMGLQLAEMYERTAGSVEGVVVYDCIDEAEERYAARARHRIIAAVVWERCGDVAEREQLLQSALTALNLNYGPDKDAFEYFVRSDRMVDEIRSLEGRIRFFDTAAHKDPTSPYIRQHYARMLLRAEQVELALSQIEEAIRIDPQVRVLYHTRGIILTSLAGSIESLDLARRRMAQAENSFRQGLAMHRSDEYSYQGLAQLYINWAKRTGGDEAAEYIAKAEETISAGLKVVRERDGLWIESAHIQEWLGHEPLQVQALEKAVRESPGSVVARYLLGRTYRRRGEPLRTLEVLEPVIKSQFDEYRVFVEYALALADAGHPLKQAIAILRLSTLYGLSDPRFIAVLGGMLYMDGNLSEAANVFKETIKRQLGGQAVKTIHFRPRDPVSGNPVRLKGKVVVVKAGYSLIDSPGLTRILCPGSRYGGLVLQAGQSLTFEIGFTARGGIADRPEIMA